MAAEAMRADFLGVRQRFTIHRRDTMTANLRREIQLGRVAAALIALALTAASFPALSQTPPPAGPPGAPSQNPVCARLEGQLAAFDRGATDAARLDQLKRLEDAANKQQFELDRLNVQSRRSGCEGSGFFLFGGQPPQCGPINAQVQQARANLDRTQADMERLRQMGGVREGQRRGLLIALSQNDCGPQYRAAVASQPRGFLDTLFGGLPIFGNNPIITPPGSDGIIPGLPGQTASGAYRTICVRTCDGYFFPISFSASQAKFLEDEKTCQRQCPAAEVALYSHRNPGEDVNQAVSMSGQPYTALPTAFAYRKEYNSSCSCRRQGESWASALKNIDNRSTVETGDIVVDDQRAKLLSQPRVDAQGRPIKPDPRGAKTDTKTPPLSPVADSNAPPAKEGAAEPDPKRKVRSVGPTFLPGR